MIRLLCCITFWLLTNGSLAQDDRIPAEARVVTSESLATDYSEPGLSNVQDFFYP
jgi:hypothetical protein